ncbi:MAG: pyrB [Firmicutes bacterium]|nr:pyrB [Bacillota bacterium]
MRLLRRINNMLKGRHLIDPMDFSVEELDGIFELAGDIIADPVKYSDSMKGKLLATLFYEPSTRTRFSFEAAMLRLGGQVIGFSEPGSSSVSKGESVADTIKTVGCYADIAVMRHPKEGAPKVASLFSDIPVINAGDGGHQHPTQTLTDLLTIKTVKGKLENLTIGFCGDLKFGRTVHSLIKALSRYENIRVILISPEELKVPEYIRNEILIKNKIEFAEAERIEDVIGELDILYMTRVQKERFFNEDDYLRLKDRFILDSEKMELASESMMVLHPLPRVNEIAYEIDSDPRAMYFQQAKYGMYARMALMLKLLGVR